jgi:flavin reductase (DIM6/NTAB) family NADH-FMN oxidoreductase RutF
VRRKRAWGALKGRWVTVRWSAVRRCSVASLTVVTARRAVPAELGDLDGFTVTAFFAVSINPPSIVVSVTTAPEAV